MPWVLKEPQTKRPRGGWRTEEFGVEVREDSAEALAARISKMRRANNIEEGDPMGEICARIAVSDPWLVRYREGDQKKPQGRIESNAKKAEDWVIGKMRETLAFTHVYDRGKRAEICAECPMNKPIRFANKEEESRYWRILMIASRGLADKHNDLGFCEAHEHDNRLAVCVEAVAGKKTCCGQESKAPMICWVD